ncbi:MAG: carbohydrate binding domain-containing protein [Planctomycetota bacterium]
MKQMSLVGAVVVACASVVVPSFAEPEVMRKSETATVPFVMPLDDVAETPTSLTFLNDGPANARVVVDGDRLLADGEEIVFWGVNICGSAAFPPKDKADAYAARLAKTGVNCVRLHHIDNNWQAENIFGELPNDTTRQLADDQIDRMNFFVSRLIEHGIYVNLNVLCSRKFVEGDGLPQDVLDTEWKLSHTLGFVDPQILELKKETARQLLATVNPYTGKTYAEDPGVAIIEITNENGLIQPFLENKIYAFPPRHQEMLRVKWNDWLAGKYGDADALRAAWGERSEPLGQAMNPPVAAAGGAATGSWKHLTQAGSEATLTGDGDAVRLDITQSGAGWTVEFVYGGVEIEKGKLYTLSFDAKSESHEHLRAKVGKNGVPWTPLGLNRGVGLTPAWKSYSYSFVGAAGETNARILFSDLGSRVGSVDFRNVELCPGGELRLPDALPLTPPDIPLVGFDALSDPTPQAKADYMAFLADTEQVYWSHMADYFRDELGVQGLIVPTIVGYTAPHVMAPYDAIDTHEYWTIPIMGGGAWATDWTVQPESMLKSPFAVSVSAPATKRVVGKPFFLSEFNHCIPNPHAAEGPLMLGGYASLQGWNGMWYFAYLGEIEGWASGAMDNMFNVANHPGVQVNSIVSALMYRRGDVDAAEGWVTATMTEREQAELLAGVGQPWTNVNATHVGVTQETALRHRIGLRLDEDQTAPTPQGQNVEPGTDTITADTGQLAWDVDDRYTIDAPKVKAMVGSGAVTFGDIRWTPADDRWHTFALIALDDAPIGEADRLLLAVTGEVVNTGMKYTPNRDSVRDQWGNAPTLIDPVHGTLDLPGYTVTPLDGTGAPMGAAVEAINADTLWYLLEKR